MLLVLGSELGLGTLTLIAIYHKKTKYFDFHLFFAISYVAIAFELASSFSSGLFSGALFSAGLTSSRDFRASTNSSLTGAHEYNRPAHSLRLDYHARSTRAK